MLRVEQKSIELYDEKCVSQHHMTTVFVHDTLRRRQRQNKFFKSKQILALGLKYTFTSVS